MSTMDKLPSSPESERALLGSIMLDNLLIEQARREVNPEKIYVPSHRRIYTSMLNLYENKQEISSITIADNLSRDGSLESAGGFLFVTNLTYGLPHVSSLKSYIARIKETARRRWLIKFAAKLSEQAQDETESDEELVAYAIAQLDEARETSNGRKPQSLEELAEDQLLRYELFFKGVSDALPTGFEVIDNHLLGGGLIPSGLYVLAAATSIGKTSLALDVTANIAQTGHRVYVVSREMSRHALFDRLVAVEGDIARWKLRPGIWQSDYSRATKAVLDLSIRPVVLDDVSLNIADVRGYLREYERRDEKVSLLVVDYLQLMEGTRKDSRAQEVASISRALKGLAMEYQIPVLALSQLSRNHAKERREPELHDLKESGEIENDSDTVFFLYGDKPEEGAKFYDRTLKCAKQREGPLFKTEMQFNGELITYRKRTNGNGTLVEPLATVRVSENGHHQPEPIAPRIRASDPPIIRESEPIIDDDDVSMF